jgi:hypothetical protein
MSIMRPRNMSIIATRVTYSGSEVHRTLAESTHLAQKFRTFNPRFDDPDLASALRSEISCQCKLKGCTFKLYSLTCFYPYRKYLRKSLNSQPSIRNARSVFHTSTEPESIDTTCLPKLQSLPRSPGSPISLLADR